MANKRVFKLATASAVAASALVAAVPASAASVTYEQAEKQVNVAREAANGLHYAYTRGADYEHKVDIKVANDELNRAKAKIAALSNASQKAYLTSRIQGTIDTVARANAYNNAVRVGTEILPAAHQAVVDAADVASLKEGNVLLAAKIKQAKETFPKVYGKELQAKFASLYLTAELEADRKDGHYAAITADRVAEGLKLIAAGKVEEAEVQYKNAEASFKAVKGLATIKEIIAADWTELGKKIEAAKTPKVESVSAINATTVEVKFNKAVDATDAAVLTNYELDGGNPTAVSVSEDKMTATLTFASAEASSKVFTVKAIKTAANALVKTEVFTKVYSYTDEAKPEIVSVTSTTSGATANSITIKASEPIAAGSTLKVDGVSTAINFNGTDTAVVTGLSLDATKSHTIEILNLSDKAATPNVTTYTSKTFNISVDTVKPVATLTAQSDKTILVTFSKSMNPATVTTALAANTVVKNESLASVNHGVATVVPGTDNKQFTIAISDALYTTATSRTLHVVLPTGMTDSLGNALDTATQSVVLTKDAVKPVATGFKVVKDADGKVTDIEVSFSEGLAAKAQGAVANPTIVDENGVLVTSFLGGLTSDAVVAGDKKVTYSVTTPAKVYGNYNFSFGGSLVTDQAETPNAASAFVYDYNFGAPTPGSSTFNLVSAVETNATSNIITVNFGTAVVGGNVANSATSLSSYTLNGKALPAGTTITLDSTKQVATITLPADSIATTDTAAVFTVSGVKSTTGASLNTYTGTVKVADNTAAVLQSAQVIGNTVYLTFNEALDTTAAADADIAEVLANYQIKSGTTTVVAGTGVATASVVANSSDKKVAITFSSVGTSGFDATQTITVETLGGDLVDANNVAAKAGIKVTAVK